MADEAVPLNYLPILLFIGISIAFGAIQLLAGRLVRPHRPYRAKLSPYESGSPLFSDARIQFPMRYYIIAMLFVIFDIEVIFIIPWAVRFQSLDGCCQIRWNIIGSRDTLTVGTFKRGFIPHLFRFPHVRHSQHISTGVGIDFILSLPHQDFHLLLVPLQLRPQ